MIRHEQMIGIANEFGTTVGAASIIELTKQDGINRYILQAIDLHQYPTLQRKLRSESWGRKSELTRYKETIKWIRDDRSKRR